MYGRPTLNTWYDGPSAAIVLAWAVTSGQGYARAQGPKYQDTSMVPATAISSDASPIRIGRSNRLGARLQVSISQSSASAAPISPAGRAGCRRWNCGGSAVSAP